MRETSRLFVPLLILSCWLARPASAVEPDKCLAAETQSEPCFTDTDCIAHIDQSNNFDRKGDYEHAVAELKSADSLRPGPILRLKIGQLLIKRRPQEGLEVLRKIDASRLCKETAEKLRQSIAAAQTSVAAILLSPPPVTELPAAQAVTKLSPATKSITPVYKRWQLWLGIMGGLSTIALAVGLGVGLGSPPSRVVIVPAIKDPVN